MQASKTSNDKCSVLFGNNPGIRATKTYGQTHGKKRKSANDLKDNEQIDSVKWAEQQGEFFCVYLLSCKIIMFKLKHRTC